MAPWRSDFSGSGTIASGSKYNLEPSPSQAGQAPNGLLNENSRGSISGIVKPETGQANFAEKIVSSPESAVSEIGRHDDAVDHHGDVVLQILVERPDLVELDHLAVDLDPLKAALAQVDQFLAVFALAPARDRGEQVEPRALRHRQYPVDHLRHGLADDRQSGRRRIGHPDPRPQE